MKIGILTYHRSHNYGALLQAVALRTVLQKMGHEVCYVDYWPEYHHRIYNIPHLSLKGIFTQPRTTIFQYRNICLMKKRKKNFDQFIDKYIEPYCNSLSDEYDILIYGSDQIWRKQPFINEFNPVYFGVHDIKAQKHVSYAASIDSLPQNIEDKKQFANLLSNLDKISVREESTKDFLSQLGFDDVSLSLDPTFLLNEEEWNAIIPPNRIINNGKPYLLFYDLQPGSFDEKEIHHFAEKKKLSIIRITGKGRFTKNNNDNTTCGPVDFVNYVRNASFVITSSYHGLLFSIIFHKQFLVSFIANSQRASSILDMIDCSSRLVDPQSPIYDISQINQTKVEKLLDKCRLESYNYLVSILEKI